MFSHNYSYEACTQITNHQLRQDNIYNTKVNCFKIRGEVLYMSGPIIYRGGYKVHAIVHYTGHVSVNSRSHKNGWIEEECVTLNISHVLSNNRLYLRTAAQYVSLFLVLAVISDQFHVVICSYSSHLFLCALGQYYRATVLAGNNNFCT